MMNPRFQAMVLVGAIIVSLTLLFLFVFISQQKQALSMTMIGEQQSINIQLDLLEAQISQAYIARLESFSKKRQIMRAFADGNRDELLRLAKPYLSILTKENSFFKTLFFVTPENKIFLRVHKPELFGDDLTLISPIVAESNRNRKNMSGFEVVKMGLHYRVVQPVFENGKYVGIVGFGIDSTRILNVLRANSKAVIGLFFPEEEIEKAVYLDQPHKAVGKHILFYGEDSVLQNLPGNYDLHQTVQQFVLNTIPYAVMQGGSLRDFSGKQVAGILVAKNIESLLSTADRIIVFTVCISLTLLAIAFVILYVSFGGLFKKITILNNSLEKSNKTLEHQVEARTAELQQEIKEKTKAQTAATYAKEEWERTFDAVPDMISILDDQHRIVRVNKAMAKQLCLPVQDLIHTKCYQAVHGTDKPPSYCPHVQLLNDHKPHYVEAYDDRMAKYLSITVAPLDDSTGNFFGSVHIARDITEQKLAEAERILAEEKLQKAEKMEAIGLMAGGVAHDLNNILSGVVSYPEMLLMQLENDDKLYKPIKAIQESGKRAAAVVADLLTVARGVATVKEIVSINTLIEDYFGSTEFKNLQFLHPKVVINLNLEKAIWNIQCSAVHIQKVLMNLITNAVEAINSEGTVLVSTTNQTIDSDTITESSLKAGEYVVLNIKDNGSGIGKHDLERIFEPFYTKKVMGHSGTGLGLTVVWNTMKDHGAFIHVDSDSSGTTFNLYFPACREESTQHGDDKDIMTLKGSGTILVVDDEVQQQDIASQMLTILGYTVKTVASGEEAVAYCRKTSVDLLLLDMLMEPGINGLETYRQIIGFSSPQKAIIASGFSESSSVIEAKKLGVGSFIKKPYSIEQLGEAVQEAIH